MSANSKRDRSWREAARIALGGSLPDSLAEEIEEALGCYEAKAFDDSNLLKRRRIASKKVIQRADSLKRAMDGVRGRYLLSSWKPMERAMASMIAELEARVLKPAKQGNPYRGRNVLRWRVFGALDDAGARLTREKAGPVLAAVLMEADRIDGKKSPKERAEFSGLAWKRWLEEYKKIKAMTSIEAIRDDVQKIVERMAKRRQGT